MVSNISDNRISLKYKHRAVYVFIVLLFLNLTWYIFIRQPDSLKHFLFGLLVPFGFSLFYFTGKNIKRYYIKRKSISSKFLDSVAFIPFVYVIFITALSLVFSLGAYFVDIASANEIRKTVGKSRMTVLVGANPDTKSDSFESDFQNLVLFINISMAQYALLPLSSEQSGIYKSYTSENIIHKKWAPTKKMMLISIFCAGLMQLLAVTIAENVIYKRIRKKRKRSPRRRNKVMVQPV